MARTSSPTVTPRLRFPEFANTEGWRATSMGEVIALEYGSALPEQQRTPGAIPVIGSNGIVGYHEQSIVEGPTIIVGRKGSVGRLTWSESNCFPIDTTFYVVSRRPASDSMHFLYRLLQVAGLERRGDSGTVPGLSRSEVAAVPTAIPEIQEQQKIADCLASLDDVIAAQARKVEALKAHKRGLMQQLFPREGETVPRLRFPEFRDAPTWQNTKLAQVAKRGSGHTPSKTKAEYYNGGVKWVSLADSPRLDSGLITETSVEIAQAGLANSSAVLHPTGSVILCRDAAIGKSAIMGVPMAVSQHFMVWTCAEDRLSNWFLYYSFQIMRPLFEKVASGSTIKTIGLPFFVELDLMIPALTEQQRIAKCLLASDDEIVAESARLKALRSHKVGLLQQLFPSPDAD